jgi:hypothetical protein
MDKKTALNYIDKWANFYLWLFGETDSMEVLKKDFFSILRPKDKSWAMVFDTRLEELNDADLAKAVEEIKALNCVVWWNQYSPRVNAVVFPEGRKEPTPDDEEIYAVMEPSEMPDWQPPTIKVKHAETLDDFKIFHSICFEKCFTPKNLLSLYQKGMLDCYIGYSNEIPVSVTAMLKQGEIHSLEFATTLPEFQKRGYAFELCKAAIKQAFGKKAKVVTIRAGGGPAADNGSPFLGTKLGFKYIG